MRRDFVATIGEDERTLLVETSDNGTFRVVVDGRERLVQATRVRPGTWSLLIDGRSYVVDLDRRKRGTVALAESTETRLLVEDAKRKRLARAVSGRDASAGKGEVIAAPIAGKVVKLLVAPEEEVSAGQGVIVLEAMKMENEISAERGGTVKTIHVQPGASVETHDLLVTLG